MKGLSPTEGIILRRVEHGERNRIVTLFTREHGKVTAYARGARSTNKRFGGQLDLFQVGVGFFGNRRRTGSMPILQQFDTETIYPEIRADIVKFAIACFWSELVMNTTADHDASSTQFEHICEGMNALNSAPHGERRDLILGFQLRWFASMGVMPPLNDDALSRANLPPLTDRGLAIARALTSGATISDLDVDHADEVGILTRAIRHSVVQKPMTSARFLHQVLSGADA